jgi:hypothetical protein
MRRPRYRLSALLGIPALFAMVDCVKEDSTSIAPPANPASVPAPDKPPWPADHTPATLTITATPTALICSQPGPCPPDNYSVGRHDAGSSHGPIPPLPALRSHRNWCMLPRVDGGFLLSPLGERVCKRGAASLSEQAVTQDINVGESFGGSRSSPRALLTLAENYAEWECLAYLQCMRGGPDAGEGLRIWASRPLARMNELCEVLRRDFPDAPEQCPTQ